MKQGDLVTIDIIDAGMEGEGIGRADGMAVFVPGAVVGDRVQVELTMVKKNFARGQMLVLEEPSPDRQEAFCQYYGDCGGCSLQAMTYDAQLKLKEKWVKDKLVRIGGQEDPKVMPTIGMEDPIEYRNKAQFPVNAGYMKKNAEGKYRNTQPVRVGFYRPRSHSVVDCDYCAIQSAPANAIAEAVRQYVEETGVSIYDEKSGIGMLRHVIVKSGFTTGEVMAIFVVNDDHLPKVERLVELCDDAVNALGTDEDWFWALESVVLNINRSKGGEIMGKDCVTIAGKNTILDQIGDLTFEISPLSFYQVNPVQTVALYDKVKEFAGLTGEETILDLYCGVGTIGLYCAEGAARIIGVEVVKQAVIDANRNAVINGIVNAEYICGKAEEVLAKRLQGVKADVVILDPPRSGCDQALIDSVLKVAPKRIVYVSCDPATMARDIKVLTERDYKLEVAQPVDMFPHTANVETVVLLSKLNTKQHIEVELNLDELDLTSAESKATYDEIKAYVLEKHGLKVSSLYISQVKRKCGLEVGQNYNLSKKEDAKVPQCPPKKEAAIMDALKHFQMI